MPSQRYPGHATCLNELLALVGARCILHAPASEQEILSLEAGLGVDLPCELRDTLLSTDGISLADKTMLIWSVQLIAERNKAMRNEPLASRISLPLTSLVAFGETQNRQLFFFSIIEQKSDLFVYAFDQKTGSLVGTLSCLSTVVQRLLDSPYPLFPNCFEVAAALDPTHQQCFALVETQLREFCQLGSPAEAEEIADAEQALGVKFTDELRSLLLLSDGISGSTGERILLPLTRIVETNLQMRSPNPLSSIYLGFDDLLFFGEEGNGDMYFHKIVDGKADKEVFEWDHESDSRICLAGCMPAFYKTRIELWQEWSDEERDPS